MGLGQWLGNIVRFIALLTLVGVRQHVDSLGSLLILLTADTHALQHLVGEFALPRGRLRKWRILEHGNPYSHTQPKLYPSQIRGSWIIRDTFAC